MLQSVLYRNEPGTVYLVDLPTSIQHGQNSTFALTSSDALESPYSSTEPKGGKRDAAISAIAPSDCLYHQLVQSEISAALDEIRHHLSAGGRNSSWCYPRRASAVEVTLPLSVGYSSPVPLVILSTTEPRTKFGSLHELEGSVVCNLRSDNAIVAVTSSGHFTIPPKSMFILASLEQGFPSFMSAWENFSHRNNGFDLILMDPPWSNRSVRHSGAYKTQENQIQDPFEKALGLVKRVLAPRAWVAVWVTNKSSIRARVVEAFQDLGLQLREEWVWVKTTTRGEPVTQLDGIWRRPYEVLLLFQTGIACEHAKRRVIAAVPDFHSRKPCLKMILEDLLPSNYTALELFARSLTSGWWSWGDEVLKFQHQSQWLCGDI